MMNAAWAVGNAVGPASAGAIAQATSDRVPLLAASALCAAALFAVRRRRAHAVALDTGS